MSSIEELKQELIYQKSAIESKGGKVIVANSNPSPKEISDGIDSIEGLDVSSATAQASEVLEGKTFYAGDSTKKTGTFSLQTAMEHIIVFKDGVRSSENKYSITIPDYMTTIRSYFMNNNRNNIDVYFNENILKIENNAFTDCSNMRFHGFNDMRSLQYVGVSSFCNCNPEDFDFSNLPSTLTQIQQKAFQNVARSGIALLIPENATIVGIGAFASNSRVNVPQFSFPVNTYASTTLTSACLQNIACHCDFVVPAKIVNINTGFNNGGCFDNITIGAKVKNIYDNAFGAINDTDPISDFYLQTVTFENPTPPSTLGKKIFALQNLEHDFKIYVPDESVEAYCAMTNFNTWYSGRIFPVSQKL